MIHPASVFVTITANGLLRGARIEDFSGVIERRVLDLHLQCLAAFDQLGDFRTARYRHQIAIGVCPRGIFVR